jgi:hypothetical protein
VDRELSATEFILIPYCSKMSEVSWNDFPQKSEVRKGLKSRVESKMAAVPERVHAISFMAFMILGVEHALPVLRVALTTGSQQKHRGDA